MNFYDPIGQHWRQLWVSRGAVIDLSGGLVDGMMRLQGTISYADEGPFAFRGSWEPRPDGSVRQFFEQAREPGVWQPWFDGLYLPLESAPETGLEQQHGQVDEQAQDQAQGPDSPVDGG
jgi:hypothetical protein